MATSKQRELMGIFHPKNQPGYKSRFLTQKTVPKIFFPEILIWSLFEKGLKGGGIYILNTWVEIGAGDKSRKLI